MRELELYIKMTELEQRVELRGNLPSVESYNRRRMGSGTVGVLLAIHEYIPSLNSKLAHNLSHKQPIGTLWKSACHSTLLKVPS